MTVKLSGRPEALDQAPGVHGPLQRVLAGSPQAVPPQAGITCCMQHGDHHNVRLREDVEHAERKALHKRSAEFAAN